MKNISMRASARQRTDNSYEAVIVIGVFATEDQALKIGMIAASHACETLKQSVEAKEKRNGSA